MEHPTTDDVCSNKRSPTRCNKDPEPQPVKRAKVDVNSLGDGAAATCPEHYGPPASSANLKIPEVSKEQAGCGIISGTDFDGESSLPLSAADIAKFEEDGFVMLRRAFDADVASACRGHLWRRMQAEGIKMDDPATWVYKKPIAETYGLPSSPKKRRGYPWTSATSPRLKAAVNQLLGKDAWTDFGCGWWMITFPGFSHSPWGAEGKWHIDGAHFRHYPHSCEVGLVPIFLLSDVHPCGGGTALLRGSHKKVAELLWERSGTTGLTGPGLSNAARDALLPPAAAEDVVETRGSAGDVMLTHPLLLHARSKNLAPVDPSGVRFMCHPAVPLKKHLDFQADPETFSPVQRTVWQSRPLSGINGPAPIVDPQDCDHSAVAFPSEKDHKKRKWKRGTTTSKRGKAAEMACDDKPRGGSSSLKEVIKDGSQLHLIDDSGCRGETSEMSNEPREASTPQPASEGEKRAIGDAPQPPSDGEKRAVGDAPQPPSDGEKRAVGDAPQPPSDGEKRAVGDAPQPASEGEKRAVGDAPQPPSDGENDAQSGCEDFNEAVSPSGNDHEEDEEVLATMGFSGFGHFT